MLRLTMLLTVLMALPCLAAEPARTQDDRERKWIEALYKRHDRNGDGKLSRQEYPEQQRRRFDRIDANTDGVLTVEEEFTARRARRTAAGRRPARPAPDFGNVKYGPHKRNVFDLWQAKGDGPRPLVIYYHGGGFRAGDKNSLSPTLLKLLLDGGVSVAAANYRLTDTAPFPAQMHDSARALQFIRHDAKKYTIDPKRIGATGGSAGAGISLWLAFHDDLADTSSKDPVARQSTRLSAAVVYGGQSSYDPRFIMKMFNTDKIHPALLPFFGLKTVADVKAPKFNPLFKEASAITHATAGDAPVLLFYSQADTPLPPNSGGNLHIHHPKFGKVLKEKLDKLGVECIVKLRKEYKGTRPESDYAKFFFRQFGLKPNDAAKN